MNEWWGETHNKYAVLVVSAILGIGVYQYVCWSQLSRSDWAAWVQAVGSIGAIIGAFLVADRQHQQNVRRAIEEEQHRKAERRSAIISVIRQCYAQIIGMPGRRLQHEDLELYLKVVPKAHFANLERLLHEAPLYEVGDTLVVRGVLDMMEVMDRARRLLETFASTPPEERKRDWLNFAGHIDDVRRFATGIAENLDERCGT